MVALAVAIAGGQPRRRWSPAALGLSYWPGGYAEAGRVFQDSAGTTAGAVGSPVGLVLGAESGTGLGPELVTNGGFDADLSGWTNGAGATSARATAIFPDGGIRVTSTGGTATHALQSVSGLSAGARYRLTARALTPPENTLTDRAVLGVQVSAYTSAGSVSQQETGAVGNLTLYPAPASGTLGVYLSVVRADFSQWGAVGNIAHFDNVSLRRYASRAAAQSTSLSRPTLRETAGGVRYLEDDGGDSLPVTLPAGDYHVAWVSEAGAVTFEESAVAVTTTLDTLRGTTQADVVVRGSAFTADEQAKLTAYWQGRYA